MDSKIERYIAAVVETFTAGRPNVEEAMRLMQIEMKSRADAQQIRLLALRRYLRLGGPRIVRQWPWTPAEAEKHTRETAELLKEAKEVAAVFADQNPGLTLAISPVRDLQRQVYLWCKNQTIKAAAAKLIADARAKLAESAFLESPTESAVHAFRLFLHDYHVFPEPSSAVPGTSDHGQQHAVDFVVMQNGKKIADTETATIRTNWENTGLTLKLRDATRNTPAAIERGEPVLRGPLPNPYEPWHYSLPRSEQKSRRAK